MSSQTRIIQIGRHIRGIIARNETLCAVLVTLAVVITGVTLGWQNNKIVALNPDPATHYTQEAGKFLSFMSNWDGPDYLAIAQHGYSYAGQTSFFPLYPLAVHAADRVTGSPLYSGLIVAWAGLAGAIYFYLKIIKYLYRLKDNLEGLRGVLFFVLFPTGIFLIATYTESLFALFALGAFYYALRKKYVPASLLTLLSTVTHVNGLFVLVLITLLAIEQKQKFAKILAIFAVGSLGLVSYMIFLAVHFHNPLGFVAAQKTHGWLQYGYADFATEIASLNGVFLLFVILSAAYWWRRRKSFAVYSLLYVAIALLGALGGFGRYALMAFPAQFMLYEYFRDKKVMYPIVVAFFGICWAYFTLQYAGGFVGG